jgi:hypothetical protein
MANMLELTKNYGTRLLTCVVVDVLFCAENGWAEWKIAISPEKA